MDDVAYYHPYPSNPKGSNVWKYFRCKRGVEYSQEEHCLSCIECRLQQIHGDKTKTIFFTVIWYNGGPTIELLRHLKKRHPEPQQTTSNPAVFHTPKLSTLVTSKWSTDWCRKFTKKLVYDLCIRDKEPLYLVDRDGFRNCIKTEFPRYIILDTQ